MIVPELHCPYCTIKLKGMLKKTCMECGYNLNFIDGAWFNSDLPLPQGFTNSQKNHLTSIEKNHFWFAPRDKLLTELVRKSTCLEGNTLEIGCGSGRLLNKWQALYRSITAVEAHPDLIEAATGKTKQVTIAQADVAQLPFDDNCFDTILSFDVIEHVKASQMLKESRRVTRKNGRLLISAPAFQNLWSYADELAGHNCRYTRNTLKALLSDNGWNLIGCNYYQCTLFPLLWLSRRILKEKGRTLERKPLALVTKLLGLINNLEVCLSSRIPMPFGTSIIIWAEVK